MAIRIYDQPQVTANALPTAYQNANHTPEAYGADVARAGQGLGAAMGAAARTLQKMEADDGKLWAAEQASKMRIEAHKRDVALRENGAADGRGHHDTLLKAFDEDNKARQEQAPNGFGKKYLQEYAVRIFEDVATQATRYEYEARQRYRITSFDNNVTQQQSFLVDNPDQLEGARVAVEASGELLSKADQEQRLPKAKSALAFAAAQGRIRQDPESAQNAIQEQEYGDVAAIIRQRTKAAGEDPRYMVTLAGIESGFDPNARNGDSTATGLYQYLDSTAKDEGNFDRTDPGARTDAAIRTTRRNSAAFEKTMGRSPERWELYLMHQQGQAGGLALLQNPDAKAADVPGRFTSPEKAQAVLVLNRGRADMTAGEFAGLWSKKYNAAEARYGHLAADDAGTFSDPVISSAWDDMTAEQKLSALRQAESAAREKRSEEKAGLAQLVADAQTAWLNGKTPEVEPTEARMIRVHGATEGAVRWQEYQDSRDVGMRLQDYQTMPGAEIQTRWRAQEPQPGEGGYAHKYGLWEKEGRAIAGMLKMREADPVGAVMNAFPGVRETLESAKLEDMPAHYAALSDYQDQLGIPDEKKAFLPAMLADSAAKRANDETLSQEARIGPIQNIMNQTTDPGQRKILWRQLERAGVPELLNVALYIAETDPGDGKAFHIMATLALTPEAGKLAQESPQNAAVTEQVYDMFSRDNIGGALFIPVDAGSAKTRSDFEMAAKRLITYRLSQNGGDIGEARKYAEGTLWRNARQIRGDGINVVLSKNDDTAGDRLLRRGFQVVRPEVREQLMAELEERLPETETAGGSAERHVLLENGKRKVDEIIRGAVWVNREDGFALFDPASEGFVADKTGKVIVFQEEAIRKKGPSYKFVPTRNVMLGL